MSPLGVEGEMPDVSRTLIVGAGGFGREVYWWMQSHSDEHWRNSFGGFLDDNSNALDHFAKLVPGIISGISDYQPQAGDKLVMAIADPRSKLKLAELLRNRGAEFATFVHSSALTVPNATVGNGSVVCPGVVLSCDTTIGEFVTVNIFAAVGHDGQVSDGCTMSPYSVVLGNATLGRGVLMGSHSSVLPGVSVGDFAKIGANSLVIRNVRGGSTMIGVPAVKLALRPAGLGETERGE